MITRRSFLAAVTAAIVAPKLKPGPSQQQLALDRFDAAWAKLKPLCEGPILQQFTIWDSVTLTPGAIADELLFPLPSPKEAFIQALGVHLPGDTLANDFAAAWDQTWLQLAANDLIYCDARLWYYPHSKPMELAYPIYANDLRDWKCRVYSNETLRLERPVTLSVILQGFAKLGDLE